MNFQQLGMLEGVSKGLEKAVTNLYNINVAKTKLQQEKEIHDLDVKQKELEIKKASYVLDPDQLKLAEEKLKADTAAKTALYNLSLVKMAHEEAKNKKEIDTYQAGMEMVKNFLSGSTKLPEGSSVRMGQFSVGTKGSGLDLNALINGGGSASPASTETKGEDLNKFLEQF